MADTEAALPICRFIDKTHHRRVGRDVHPADFVGLGHPVHQAPLVGRRGVQEVAGQGQLLGAGDGEVLRHETELVPCRFHAVRGLPAVRLVRKLAAAGQIVGVKRGKVAQGISRHAIDGDAGELFGHRPEPLLNAHVV